MEQQPWDAGWSATIGRLIRQERDAQALSAQELSDKCAALGYRIARGTIAKTENGDRRHVPLQEVAVIAAALDVPPVTLMFDVTAGDTPHLVTPDLEMPPIGAIEWWSGNDVETYGLRIARTEQELQHAVARFAKRDDDERPERQLSYLRAVRSEMVAHGMTPPPIRDDVRAAYDESPGADGESILDVIEREAREVG